MVFVFGSNEAGRHGKGAAEFARRFHGAILGRGESAQGNAYAIPTKDARLRPMPLRRIWQAMEDFLEYAASHPDETFQVTRVGCGLAGYRDEDIWRCLLLPENCLLPGAWLRRLNPALMRVIVAGGRDYGGHKGEWQRLRQDLDQLRDRVCCCGCRQKIVTPLNPAKWHFTDHGFTVSLSPSIGLGTLPCRSHYWIRRSHIDWYPP